MGASENRAGGPGGVNYQQDGLEPRSTRPRCFLPSCGASLPSPPQSAPSGPAGPPLGGSVPRHTWQRRLACPAQQPRASLKAALGFCAPSVKRPERRRTKHCDCYDTLVATRVTRGFLSPNA